MRSPLVRFWLPLLCLLSATSLRPGAVSQAQTPSRAVAQRPAADAPHVSIVYTGRSLGALGARRQQDEHELLTEQAYAEGITFSLVSHAAWRVPGIVVFLPGTEPEGDELEWVLANRAAAERVERVRALRSENGLLLQDPWQPGPDLLGMLLRNPRQRLDFADLIAATVTVSRLRQPGGNRIIIVEEPGAIWPTDARAWQRGVMNRIDLLESRVFELPMNIGGVGPRATLMRRFAEESERQGGAVVRVDLGHQRGELNVAPMRRAMIDFTALQAMGVTAVVPYEFELSLGVEGLRAVRDSFPDVALVSANLRPSAPGLVVPHRIITLDGARVGLIGVTNPAVRERLPRARLGDFTIDAPVPAVQREVTALRERGVEAIVVLSNLDPAANAQIASEIRGVDAILADMPVRWAPEVMRTRVELPERPNVRPGTPAFVARGVANGLAVGKLDLEFRRADEGRIALAAVAHRHERVNDRTPADTALMTRLFAMAAQQRPPRGELLVPSFTDLLDRHQDIGGEREEARGRITKALWEEFMARVIRVRGEAEVAVLPRLDQFPPLIGKLHEDEIQEWVFTEDRLVVLDLSGGDLKALLRSDARGELVSNGIDLGRNTILGHPIRDNVLYRVATTEVLTDGARAGFFTRALRVRRRFTADTMGVAHPTVTGTDLTVRDLLLGELRRIRRVSKGDSQIDSVAAWMRPDPAFVPLTTLAFERPTLSLLVNDVAGNEGYGTVPESRIRSKDAWVIALGGRLVLSRAMPTAVTDYGLTVAYGRQTVTADGSSDVSETADDIRLDATYRPTLAGAGWVGGLFPFARGEVDTEFSPTENRVTQTRNPRQQAVRALGGVLMPANARWPRREASLAVENDFGQPNVQVGVQSRVEYVRPVGKAPPPGTAPMTYRLRSDLTYLLPARRDNAAQLALRYNQIHDLLIPLANELSLSVTADLFVFQGKVKATRGIGTNSQLRVGLTYDRIWKPRYQPFF
jgi:hypothetical protein